MLKARVSASIVAAVLFKDGLMGRLKYAPSASDTNLCFDVPATGSERWVSIEDLNMNTHCMLREDDSYLEPSLGRGFKSDALALVWALHSPEWVFD
jgi:hypothetical protein